MGNDFFREMGDVFAAHSVLNPDQSSEIALLQEYAPNLSKNLLRMLTGAFSDLRAAVEAGKLSYPYSTRELVNIVKHLSAFPEDGIGSVLEDVFSFDTYDPQLRLFLFDVFRRHGIPLRDSRRRLLGNLENGARGSALAVPHPLPPAKVVGSIIERSKTSSSSSLDLACVRMTQSEPLLISTGQDGQPSSTMKWRGTSSADTGKKEASNRSEDGGLYGAEWTELRWSSARSMQFTEKTCGIV